MNEQIIKCVSLSVRTKIPGNISMPVIIFLLSVLSVILHVISGLYPGKEMCCFLSMTGLLLSKRDWLFLSAFGCSLI